MKPRSVFPVLILALLSAACGKPEPAPQPAVAVKVAQAERAELVLMVRAPASVFARQQANVTARITAAVRALAVRKGDTVTAGQVLARLEDRDLLAQHREADAAVLDAQGTQATEIERARGQVATSEAALNQAQKIYERRRDLFQQGAIPAKDLLVSQTEFNQARTALEVARKTLELLESQTRGGQGIAHSRLEEARARRANLDAQLEFTQIRSPFAGVITEQFVFPGDIAKPDAPLFTVMDLSVAVARAQVPEAEAGPVARGQSCAFQSVDSGDAAFRGRISVVNAAVDAARRTVEVWCEIPNLDRRLRGGAFGAVTMFTGKTPNGVVVPEAAVQVTQGTHRGWVMVVDSQNIARKSEVETGQTSEGRVQILKGLAGGERVIVEGGYGLPDGTAVKPEGEKREEKKNEAEKK